MTTELAYADLEIGLYRQDANDYAVELHFRRPDDQADRAPVRGLARFDFADLRQYALQPKVYSQRLSQSLFADPAVLAEFSEARDVAETADRPLRLCLFIDRSAPELHSLRWEMLCDAGRTGKTGHSSNRHRTLTARINRFNFTNQRRLMCPRA